MFKWLAIAMTGCVPGALHGGPNELDEASDSESLYLPPIAHATLLMGSEAPAFGMIGLLEWDGSDTPTCTGGAALDSGDWSGIAFGYAAFADREVGTASVMPTYHRVSWNPQDPYANGGETPSTWHGTIAIAEWSTDTIRFDLLDGTWCVDPDGATCTAEQGELTLVGDRMGPFSGQSDRVVLAFTDVLTGSAICAPPYAN